MNSDMRKVILDSPNQITHSLEVNKDVKVEGDFDSIILAGMGGSAHPGELLNAFSLPNLPLYIHRDYGLPKLHGKHPLIIISSYSGTTEEALSSYEAAKAAGYAILVNASGGTLIEWAKRDNVPFALIDYPGMQPRHTTFASFTGTYAALRNSNLTENIDTDLHRVAQALTDAVVSLKEPAKQLAQHISGAIPIYMSSDALRYAAWNFKIQTNENAKYPAYWNTFPELNHNEMLGFSKLPQLFQEGSSRPRFLAIMIRDAQDHPRTKARMDITKELYESWGVEVADFEARGETLLEKTFYTVVFGLWTTYFLALEYNIDPVPVEGVEAFKAKLKEVAG